MADEYTNASIAFGAGPPEPPPRPAFFNRLWMVFVQPGELFKALALNPAWFPVALFAALVAAASTWLIPAELYQEIALQSVQGQTNSDAPVQITQVPPIVFSASAMGFAFLASLVFPVVLSVVTYVIFVFIRGDQATFKQHLSVVAHTGIITSVGGTLNAFVNARAGDLTQVLSRRDFLSLPARGLLHRYPARSRPVRPVGGGRRRDRAGGDGPAARPGIDRGSPCRDGGGYGPDPGRLLAGWPRPGAGIRRQRAGEQTTGRQRTRT